MKTFVIALILLFAVSGYVYAQGVKEAYELQERCGKSAEEFFKKYCGDYIVTNKAGRIVSNYTNHYNRKLNKCFILVTETVYNPKEIRKELGVSSTYKTLDDINENKPYGFFWKLSNGALMSCEVLGKNCKSEAQWDALVKPYMEE